MSWEATYVGMRYVKRGRDSNGIDCWGLVVLAYRDELRIDLPLYGMQSADDYRAVARAIEVERQGETWQPVTEPKDFDLVLMTSTIDDRGTLRDRPVHIGLVASRSVLHCEEGRDTVFVPRADPSVMHRIVGYYRHWSMMT